MESSANDRLELLRMAKVMQDTWGECYSRHNGGRVYASAKMSDLNNWVPYAEQAMKAGARPEDWVYAQFRKNGRIRFTTALSGKNALKAWREYARWTGAEKVEKAVEGEPAGSAMAGQVLSRLCDTRYMLVSAGYADNLSDPAARQFVLTRLPGFLDPLSVVVMAPDDNVWKSYGCAIEREFPPDSAEAKMLVEALYGLDLALAASYIESRLCPSNR